MVTARAQVQTEVHRIGGHYTGCNCIKRRLKAQKGTDPFRVKWIRPLLVLLVLQPEEIEHPPLDIGIEGIPAQSQHVSRGYLQHSTFTA